MLKELQTILSLFFSVLLFCSPGSADEQFVAGKHYEEIKPPLSTSAPPGQVEVLEFFWYGCPHCFEFEGHIAQWIEKQKSYVSFARVPAVFSDTWFSHAKAFYAAAELAPRRIFRRGATSASAQPGRGASDLRCGANDSRRGANGTLPVGLDMNLHISFAGSCASGLSDAKRFPLATNARKCETVSSPIC